MKHRILYSVMATSLLVACANNAPAPVLDISEDPANLASQTSGKQDQTSHSLSAKQSKDSSTQYSGYQDQTASTHRVMAGETLFSIAWRYSLDFKQLAQINRLENYRIYPGQELQLKQPLQNIDQLEKPSSDIFDSQSLIAAINHDFLNKPARSSAKNASKNNGVGQNASVKRVSYPSNAKVISQSQSKPAKYTGQIPTSNNKKVKRWIWPVNGKLVGRFSNKSNRKGLDIVAKRGTPVRATAEGKVVYSGNGLRGYGQLVIIKHNDTYLSAYAHNEKIHVQENEYVKAGQRIADLGSSDSDKNKLHFEIRYKGKPVDPLKYLPKTGNL